MFISSLLCLGPFLKLEELCVIRDYCMNSGNAWPILPNWLDGSHRLMFHFENYNAAVSFRHFKLDAVNAVLILLTPWGAYLAVLVF